MDAQIDDQPVEAEVLPPVGYQSPPVQSRFKPGQSGNPSGRRKGSRNLKTLFNQVLAEEISLREGSELKKVSKAEALIRGLVVGALKGDARSLATLFRLAEHTGHFGRKRAGVNLNPGKLGKVANDNRADWGEAWTLSPGTVAYVWHAGRHASAVQASLETTGFEIRAQIIWAKPINAREDSGHGHGTQSRSNA